MFATHFSQIVRTPSKRCLQILLPKNRAFYREKLPREVSPRSSRVNNICWEAESQEDIVVRTSKILPPPRPSSTNAQMWVGPPATLAAILGAGRVGPRAKASKKARAGPPRNSLCSQRKTPFPQRESNGICFLLVIGESIKRDRGVPEADHPAPPSLLKPKAKIRVGYFGGGARSTRPGSPDLSCRCCVGRCRSNHLGALAAARRARSRRSRWEWTHSFDRSTSLSPSQGHASELEQGGVQITELRC
jgi:hypothetical protein